MKHKTITEVRALQLSNDMSEGINSGTLHEWREVARYWRAQYDQQTRRLMGISSSVSALTLAKSLESNAIEEMEKWAKGETK